MADLPDRDSLESELLLLRLRRGDQSAAGDLVQRREARLFYFIRKLVTDEHDAWDVLQQTWVRVLRGVHKVRTPQSLAPWLYTVARNAAFAHRNSLRVEYARQAAAEPAVLAEIPATVAPLPTENIEAVHHALAQLPAPQREVITLFFLEDFSLEQIAAVVGAPVGTVKSRLHYAKQALRELLQASQKG